MKFKIVPIVDTSIKIIDGDRGKNYPKNDDFSERGYCLFLNAKNVTSTGMIFDNISFITKEKDELLRKGKLVRNDIILTTRGTVGNFGYYNNDVIYENMRINSGMVIIRNEDPNIDTDYLYWLLRSSFISNQIKSLTSGSAQPQLPITSLNKVMLILPPLEEQKKIASMIINIDDKLVNSRRIIQKIEEISQLLFKHWFIDFEFPNEKGQPYQSSGGEMVDSELGRIPEDFKVKTFKDISKLTMGLSPKSDSYNESFQGLPLLNGAADFKGDKLRPNKYTNDSKRNSSAGDLVFCIRATIGNITYSDKEYSLGRSVAAITPNNKRLYELIHFNLHHQIEALKAQAVGSVIIGLSKPDIENIKVVLPNEQLLTKFHEMTSTMFNKKYNLEAENEKLEVLRDTLLPKLLSGELELPVEVDMIES